MKILVVDDEPALLNIVARILTKQGHTVEKADNGQQAWDLFSHSSDTFDVILTDVRMPGIDGLGLLRLIRENGYRIQVIFMAGHVDSTMAASISELRSVEVILKPFGKEKLVSVLSKYDRSKDTA